MFFYSLRYWIRVSCLKSLSRTWKCDEYRWVKVGFFMSFMKPFDVQIVTSNFMNMSLLQSINETFQLHCHSTIQSIYLQYNAVQWWLISFCKTEKWHHQIRFQSSFFSVLLPNCHTNLWKTRISWWLWSLIESTVLKLKVVVKVN